AAPTSGEDDPAGGGGGGPAIAVAPAAEASAERKAWERLSGVALTAVVILMLEGLHAAGLSIPSSPFLLIVVVYSAFAGGLGYGLLSAAGSIVYQAYVLSEAGGLLDDP